MANLNRYSVFILTLIFVQFFRIKISPIPLGYESFYAVIIFFLCAAYFLFNSHKNNKLMFKKHLFIYLFFAGLNMISCYIFRGQSIVVSFTAWSSLLYIFLYIGFSNFKLSIRDLEKVIEWMFFIILISYIVQNLAYPILLFNLDIAEEKLEMDLRVRIFSDGILSLGGIYYLNKFFEEKKTRYAIYFFLFLIVVFLQGYRILMFASFVSAFVLFYRYYGFMNKKTFIYGGILCILFIGFMQTGMFKEKIGQIVERSETDNLDNEDYVRVASLIYFYNDHFKSDTEMFLGSGCSLTRDRHVSTYSDYMNYLKERYHFFPIDWGLIGLSWEAGIPFVICFILLMLRVVFLKVEKRYYYLGVWQLFLLISVTKALSYMHTNLVYMAIVLLIAERAHSEYVKKHTTDMNAP